MNVPVPNGERECLQRKAVETENRIVTLEDHDFKTCQLLGEIRTVQALDAESNLRIRTLLEQSADLHKESASNLLVATTAMKTVTAMQMKQQDWFQKEVSNNNKYMKQLEKENSAFWKRVIWRTLIVAGVIILGIYGLQNFTTWVGL